MEFNQEIYAKMKVGDPLSDEELKCALGHFSALDRLLGRCGPEWGFAWKAAIRERVQLEAYQRAREEYAIPRTSADSRYPYTYACDYIRALAGYGDGGTILARADASRIRQGVAKALGMDDEELAQKLADYFKAHEDELAKESVKAFMQSLNVTG